MRKILAMLVAVIFLLAPIAFAEEVNETIADVNEEVAPEVVTEQTTEEPNLIVTNEVSESNLSETESEAITNTIESGETSTTEEVSVTPDMPLRWGLKTWSEKFSLLLTFNKFKKAEKKLEHARERLQEMKQMATKKNLKALAKAQKAHAEIVAELSEDEENLANENLTTAEKIDLELQKHIQVLEGVQTKLTAKGVPTQGIDNALVKSRSALNKFQNMNEIRKAKLSEMQEQEGKKNCATLCADIPFSETAPAVTESDLNNGWYYGQLNQKRIGTPASWIHSGEGSKSAIWSTSIVEKLKEKSKSCDCGTFNIK